MTKSMRSLLFVGALLAFMPQAIAVDIQQPNILLIYADDIGYGDLGCYGATKVATPHIDRLAAEGLRFTDAHCVASVCTPSRYSLLTGEYAFRKRGTGIASGIRGLLIDTDRTTLPSMLKNAGYSTGIVGKWHLGLGTEPTDYNQPIKPGPNEIGFDYAWIMPATGDRVPCVWVENDHVVNLDPTDPIKINFRVKRGTPDSILMGVPRIGQQIGGKAALWDDENLSTVIAQKSCDFIDDHQAKPFFLEVSTHNIHVPRVPNPRFVGKSDCGPRGDTIAELDWIVGDVIGKLDSLGLSDNTIVIFTSDNGGILDNNGPDKVHGIGDPDSTNGHKPNGVLRGYKYDVWEGGTRVPMIVRWPSKVRPGESDALVSQVDFLASFAAMTDQTIQAGQAPDSEDHLASLLGTDPNGRETLIEQKTGDLFGFRQRDWKLLPTGGKKGGKQPTLYDLSNDPGETNDLSASQPERVSAMMTLFNQIIAPITSQEEPQVENPQSRTRKAKPPSPNVLVIAVDDLSDYVSILQNHPGIKTPNFDRLAKRSLNFSRAYCAAPICNPSRVAVLTGLAPHQTGVYQLGDRLSNSAPATAAIALEENFKRHGYETYLTGKYYHASEDHWLPKDRLDAAWTQRLPPFSDHSPKDGPNKVIGSGILSIGPASIGIESMADTAIVKNTRGWFSEKHDKPFLIVHGINKPHLSFVVPQQFFDMYPLDSLLLPETVGDDYADIPASVRTMFLEQGNLKKFAQIRDNKNGWKEVMQAYLASISFCDWVLGTILDELDASKFADNTIIVLWSDHGYHIGEKEWLHKRALWTQTTRVPFLIGVHGMSTAGNNCTAPVSLLDIYPTLIELCELDQEVPQPLAGHSLAPLLKNPEREWPNVAITSHDIGNAAITDARYHYIHYADGSEELYDHQTDPREYNNLALRLESKPIIARLAKSVPSSWIPAPHKGKSNREKSE